MDRAETDHKDEIAALRVFTYAVTEKAPLYLAIIDALVAAKERFLLQMRPAEVVREIASVPVPDDSPPGVPPPGPVEVAACLEQLAEWGNVAR